MIRRIMDDMLSISNKLFIVIDFDRGRDAAIEGMFRSRASDLREWVRTR